MEAGRTAPQLLPVEPPKCSSKGSKFPDGTPMLEAAKGLAALVEHKMAEQQRLQRPVHRQTETHQKASFSYLMHHSSLTQPEVLFHMWNYVAQFSLKHFKE